MRKRTLSSNKILVYTPEAVSLKEVARQIGSIYMQEGYPVNLLVTETPKTSEIINYKGVIIVHPFYASTCARAARIYVDCKKYLNGNVCWYTMSEGIPEPKLIPDWIVNNCEVIANSYFVKKCLEKAGIKVREVIWHGVPYHEVKIAAEQTFDYIQKIMQNFKGKCIIGLVTRGEKRKGLDLALSALDAIYQERKDFVVLAILDDEGINKIRGKPYVYLVSRFGERNHVEILGFLGAVDYLLFPSMCESFGMPTLEANAMGTPCIIPWIPPFNEFLRKDLNITFEYETEELKFQPGGVYYVFHLYDVNDLKYAIEYAIDLRLKNPSEYYELRQKLNEEFERNKEKYFSEFLYKKFMKYVK